MENTSITIGYWKIRGLLHTIKSFVAYLGANVKFEHYTDPAKWFQEDKLKLGLPFANLPYLIDHQENANITETISIITYLCRKQQPEILGKTLKDQGEVHMLLEILHNSLRSAPTGLCYSQDSKVAVIAKIEEKLGQVKAYLGTKQYFCGDYITAGDIYMIDLYDFFQFVYDNTFFDQHPEFKAHHDRLNAIKSIQNWKASEDYKSITTFNGQSAKINNA